MCVFMYICHLNTYHIPKASHRIKTFISAMCFCVFLYVFVHGCSTERAPSYHNIWLTEERVNRVHSHPGRDDYEPLPCQR